MPETPSVPQYEAGPEPGSIWRERPPYDWRVIRVVGPAEPDWKGRERVLIEVHPLTKGVNPGIIGRQTKALVTRFNGKAGSYLRGGPAEEVNA